MREPPPDPSRTFRVVSSGCAASLVTDDAAREDGRQAGVMRDTDDAGLARALARRLGDVQIFDTTDYELVHYQNYQDWLGLITANAP
jgi:hypothetical protein